VQAEATRASKVVVVAGTVSGVAVPYSNPKLPLYNTTISAKGTALGLSGPVLVGGFQTSVLVGLTATVSNGIATFSFPASGSTYLTVKYTGTGRANFATPVQSLTFTGTIVGGGGAFAGATGSFTGSVSINDLTHAFSLSYTLKVA
jgi:hypothetical protein